MEITHQTVLEVNKKYYNLEADHYLEKESYAYADNIVAEVKENLKFCDSRSLQNNLFLDATCGSGFLTKIVKQENLFKAGIGIDISEEQIRFFNEKVRDDRFKAFVGDVTNLAYQNEHFDKIAGYSVLHHFFDYYKALDEFCRVLKSKGILYFDFEPNYNFKKLMKIPLILRRKFIDYQENATLQKLEEIAEFHQNYKPVINIKKLSEYLIKNDFKILKIGKRIPKTKI